MDGFFKILPTPSETRSCARKKSFCDSAGPLADSMRAQYDASAGEVDRSQVNVRSRSRSSPEARADGGERGHDAGRAADVAAVGGIRAAGGRSAGRPFR